MAFNQKEQEIITWGLQNGKTKEEVKTAISNFRAGIAPSELPEETQSTFMRTISGIAGDIKKRGENVIDTSKAVLSEEINPLQGGVNIAGQVAGGATDILAGGLKAIPGAETVGKVITGMSKKIADIVTENPNILAGLNAVNEGIDAYSAWKEANPQDAKTVEAVFNLGTLIPFGMGEKIGVKSAIKAGENIAETTGKIVSKTGEIIAPAIETAKDFGAGIKNIAEMTAEGATRIPARIATNVAEKQAVKESIETLPTKVAKEAARDGVDIQDVKYLYSLPAGDKAPLRELWQSVKDFESGKSKTNPIEVVGKPIVERIKTLESEAGKVGQKLGEVAKELGDVKKADIFDTVLNSLRKVKGLNELSIDDKGNLDFSNTALFTRETLADRKAIQSIFSQAVNDGTGISKHRLRQELFEILGGKKKSLASITDTQDRAFQAIRQGLSDVLDSKNANYKKFNAEYAKIATPLQDIRRFMKNVVGADEDILEMSAGLLARRLTSMAASNPQIRNILRAMDEATKTKGKTSISIENLQDFYNVLDRYYDIAGKTGFQGQVKAGIESATGIKDAVSQAVGEIVGKTDAVKRKAIEKALEEALR